MGKNADPLVLNEILSHVGRTKELFKGKLAYKGMKDAKTIEKHANFLIISMNGLPSASKVFTKKQLDDYIETIISSI